MKLALPAALLVHVVLATGYDAATPMFEAPDEADHFRYAQVVATARALPVHRRHATRLGRHFLDECGVAHHPPLYYGLLAGTLALADATDIVGSLTLGNREAPENRRRSWKYGHAYDELWPWSTEVIVLRVLRLLSVAFGLVTLLAIHRLGRIVFPARPAVADLAVLLLATLPAWSYAHGALDNGNLASTFVHLVLLAGAATVARGHARLRDGVALGLLTSAAILTKLTAFGLAPPLALIAVLLLLRSGERRGRTAAAGALLSAIVVVTCTWFFVRNWNLYGDPLSAAAHADVFQRSRIEDGGAAAWLLEGVPRGLLRSAVQPNLLPTVTPWLPPLAVGLAVLAAAGVVVGSIRDRRSRERPDRAQVALLLLAALGTGLVFLRFNLVFKQAQARYFLPAAGPLALLGAYGLVAWARFLPARAARRAGSAFAVILVAGASGLLLFRFVPEVAVLRVPDGTSPVIAVGVSGRAATDEARIPLVAPAEDAVLAEAPIFRWRPPDADAAVPPTPCFVRVTDASGRVLLDSLAHLGLTSTHDEWAVPARIWSTLPANEPLRWFVRRAPDRRARESTAEQPASAARTITRAP